MRLLNVLTSMLILYARLIESALCRNRHSHMSMSIKNYSGAPRQRVLVLGGSGFVGSKFVKEATRCGFDVVSLSRRGQATIETETLLNEKITWIAGDASEKTICDEIVQRYGPFDACVHAVGLLLDIDSGLSSLNRFASGSGSIPTISSSYEAVTKQTAFNILESLDKFNNVQPNDKKIPFVFISAAEAGWTLPAPAEWLERYLVAKRAVEARLLSSASVRPVIFRPSLIWTWERPQALLSVIPFIIGSKFLPFVDKPVTLEALAAAMIRTIADDTSRGIYRCEAIEQLSKSD